MKGGGMGMGMGMGFDEDFAFGGSWRNVQVLAGPVPTTAIVMHTDAGCSPPPPPPRGVERGGDVGRSREC